MTKDFNLFFFILSTMTNLKEHFSRLYPEFWELLRKFRDQLCNTWEVVENTNTWKG